MGKEETILSIKKRFEAAKPEQREELFQRYQSDEREGVIHLLQTEHKKDDIRSKEMLRLTNMLSYERKYQDYHIVCGIDEVGRGPLAGPVVAAAVVLPVDCKILWLNDSKQLSEKKREDLYPEILEKAIAVGIGCVSHTEIDRINILQATYQAMRDAIVKMSLQCGAPDVLLNDAVVIPKVNELFPERSTGVIQIPIIKGDAKSLSIAAASVVAKVTRDHMMVAYAKLYEGYGFESNKGYGSEEHIKKLKKDGPCEIHRRSFIKAFVSEN